MPEISLNDTFPGAELGTEEAPWVQDFLKVRELQGRAQALDAEIGEIYKQPPSHKDSLKSLKQEYDARRQMRVLHLRKHFERRMGSQASLKFLQDRIDGFDWPFFIDWGEIDEAVKGLPGGIGEVEKMKRIGKLESEKEALEKQIQKLSPPEYFNDRGQDLRELFVAHWATIQARLNGPAGPDGQSLEQCAESVERAYNLLNLQALVNRDSKLSPHYTRYQKIGDES
jgi:hypothetical protein